MAEAAAAAGSIRGRLLLYLIGTLLLVIVGVGAVTYAVALRAANDAYDRALLDPALDIAEHLRIDATGAHVDLPTKALEALVYDQADRLFYQVRTPDGTLIAGDADLPPPPPIPSGEGRFFDAEYRGQPIRVAALRAADGSTVQVSETLHKRHKLVEEILAAEVVTILSIGAVSIALAWVAIAKGLRPLERLRAQLLSRSNRDLRPLTADAAPVEVAPLIEAFNRLLQQVHQATAQQQRFMADAAHQLRTPLAGLQMHLEILLRQGLPGALHDEISRLHGATVRAGRLATQLLALSKAEAAPVKDRPLETVDLRSVAGEAARDWAPRAIANDTDLGFSLEPAVILGDRALLPDIFNNLIDNALRYTPRGGSITVRTGCDGGVPYLCVEDTGPGIPQTERANVLERFYRVPGTSGDGSGLGLSIVKQAVDRHGGAVSIDARPDRSGTCVRVTFPALAGTHA
ncbi:MAG TPA: sensor histidine kinase [Casimicrobiaceae bacterium]|jgi:two-component system sensor histidine kinase TctE